MNTRAFWLAACCLFIACAGGLPAAEPGSSPEPKRDGLGVAAVNSPKRPKQKARYRLEQQTSPAKSTVVELAVAFGASENGTAEQWTEFEATKANGELLRVWILCAGSPPRTLAEAGRAVARYIVQEGDARPLEFRERLRHRAVLPALGAWPDLIPRANGNGEDQTWETFPATLRYLGHHYNLARMEEAPGAQPPENTRVVELTPDVLVGAASNTRQKDEKRRYDNSDYELVRLTQNDYRQMVEAGINCLKVDAEQLRWVQELDAFYWGVGGADLPYPECLYRSSYLGPTLFLDEPAVGTRDSVIRPRLAKEESFRKSITPQMVFEEFKTYFQDALEKGAPVVLANSLRDRPDIELGEMQLKQENLFSWETMVSTAGYQLSQDPHVPAAMVFEPPGRVGTLRTLPELDMTYGCQIPADDPKNLIDIIYGFLRGAARLTGKSWGTSIYGAVDRADAYWFLTHAYDLGATRFFFWDNFRSACVPYGECLALARNLRAHAESYPRRDLQQLNSAAEVAILLPPGYNLGHVQLGKGSLWGVGELNLERINRQGVKYRVVMSNFFAEIERCLRLGVAFDLLWDLPGIELPGYREVVHIREDGKVQMRQADTERLLDHARAPARPDGIPPGLQLEVSSRAGTTPMEVTARASVTETSSPVYYTLGTDNEGVYHNAYVAWELYGPNEEDYRFLTPEGNKPKITQKGREIEARVSISLRRPGTYRLRAATVDLAGRTAVAWESIVVSH